MKPHIVRISHFQKAIEDIVFCPLAKFNWLLSNESFYIGLSNFEKLVCPLLTAPTPKTTVMIKHIPIRVSVANA